MYTRMVIVSHIPNLIRKDQKEIEKPKNLKCERMVNYSKQ